jgi:hypothetical protein
MEPSDYDKVPLQELRDYCRNKVHGERIIDQKVVAVHGSTYSPNCLSKSGNILSNF